MIKIVAGLWENKDIIEACEIFKKENKDVEIQLVKNENDLVKSILDDKYYYIVQEVDDNTFIVKNITAEEF